MTKFQYSVPALQAALKGNRQTRLDGPQLRRQW